MPGLWPHSFTFALRVGDVGLDLLERAAGEERRGAGDERDPPAVGQAGADADHVLLGDADVDQPLRERLAGSRRACSSRRESLTTATIRSSCVGELDQRALERVAAVEALAHSSQLLAARAPSARRSGTLWCHSTRSSMNETPWPLIVWAITQLGRPALERAARRSVSSSASTSWPSTVAHRPAERLELRVERVERVRAPRCARPAGGRCGRRSRSGCRGRGGRRP